MQVKELKYFDYIFVFIIVFSFINDNFVVDLFGENSLKIIMGSFIIFKSKIIIAGFIKMKSKINKLFLFFLGFSVFVFLLQVLQGLINRIDFSVFTIISILIVVSFFQFYNLNRLLYFLWASVMFSVVICYFNDPISEWTFRTSGGTMDPNEFATQLLFFLFISFHLFKINKNRLFIFISIIFFIYGFFKAGSMSAFLFLFLFFIILALIKRKVVYKYTVSFKGISVLILLFITLSFVDLEKVEAVSNILGRTENTGTANTRFDSWVAGYNMLLINTVFGVGIHEYDKNSQKYAEVNLDEGSLAAHNLYLKLFAESGFIVFLLFLLFLVNLIYSVYKKDTSIYLLFSLLAVLFMGMTLNLIYDKYFWLIISVSLNLLRQKKRKRLVIIQNETSF